MERINQIEQSEQPEQAEQSEQADAHINYGSGLMSWDFFNTYIKDHMCKKSLAHIKKSWNKIEKSDIFIEYIVIGFRGYLPQLYNELWLLDIDIENKYYAVYIPHINSSSEYSLSRCYMEDEYDENNKLNYNELLDMICSLNDKNKVSQLLSTYKFD